MLLAARSLALALALALPVSAVAQKTDSLVAPYSAEECPSCAGWDAPQKPLRVFGNTYYVGTRGLAALLITSEAGHVLVDGGLPSSAPKILANIAALGFDVRDVKLIVNSHAHYDHAGGLAALQRASGARIVASPPSAPVLMSGTAGPDDPQHAVALRFPATGEVHLIDDGDTARVGPLVLTAHLTPGHTRGGTSWSWRSCEGERCVDLVYADSQTPVSADGFSFTSNDTYPSVLADFERGFSLLERIPCEILITPHPAASNLWERIAGTSGTLIDGTGCQRYAATARQQLATRVQAERAKP